MSIINTAYSESSDYLQISGNNFILKAKCMLDKIDKIINKEIIDIRINSRENLDELKRKAFSVATRDLYDSYPLESVAGKVIFQTRVCPDGYGDFFGLTAATTYLKQVCPLLNLHIITAISDDRELPNLDKEKFTHESFLYNYEYMMGNYIYLPIDIPRYVLEKIDEADIVVEIPAPFSSKSSLQTKIAENPQKFIHIHEYGYLSGALSINNYSLGVDLFDEGIFIHDLPSPSSLLGLQSEILKKTLFQKTEITNEDVENYNFNNSLYVAYIKDQNFQKLFLNIAVRKHNKNKIDLCMPVENLKNIENETNYFKEAGIKNVKLIKKNGITDVLEIQNEGKEIRIINIFPFSAKDFRILQLSGENFVGCTGDQSISELISFNRFFFYEIIAHKKQFFCDLLNTSIKILGDRSSFTKYLELILRLYEESEKAEFELLENSVIFDLSAKIEVIISSNDIILEYEKLIDVIKKINFYPNLIRLIKRAYTLKNFPEIKNLETELFSKLIYKEIDIDMARECLSEKISAIYYSKIPS
jgi:hypothetical protein